VWLLRRLLWWGLMSEDVVSEVVRSRDYYKGVLDNCRSYLVHSVVSEAGLVRCPRCGRIYSKASVRDKCPYCYETPVVELSYTESLSEVEGYCWNLYGHNLAFIELLADVARILCGKFRCNYSDITIELTLHPKDGLVRVYLVRGDRGGVVVVRATGLTLELLRELDRVVEKAIERGELLEKAGISHVAIVTSYDRTTINYRLIIAEGFLDASLNPHIERQLGASIAYRGDIVKVVNVKTGDILKV
jgi:phage FluMu protein Com